MNYNIKEDQVKLIKISILKEERNNLKSRQYTDTKMSENISKIIDSRLRQRF